MTASPPPGGDQVGPLLGRAVADLERSQPLDSGARRRLLGDLGIAMASSAKTAGAGAVASGRWLADVVTDAVPYLPIRDAATLRAHHGPDRTDEQIADALVRNASRATAAVGAVGGGLTAFGHFGPATVVALPIQLAAETALMSLIEVKLVAELHEIYGVGIAGTGKQRAAAYLVAWATRRGIDPTRPASAPAALGLSTRRVAALGLRRRSGKTLWSVLPLFLGAAIGAQANHRETRRMAESIRVDLRQRRPLTGSLTSKAIQGLLARGLGRDESATPQPTDRPTG